jgi:hypothetical protein
MLLVANIKRAPTDSVPFAQYYIDCHNCRSILFCILYYFSISKPIAGFGSSKVDNTTNSAGSRRLENIL